MQIKISKVQFETGMNIKMCCSISLKLNSLQHLYIRYHYKGKIKRGLFTLKYNADGMFFCEN